MLRCRGFEFFKGDKMPSLLNKLSSETTNALGKMTNLASRYEALRAKNANESLRDDKDAGDYVDDLIKRYKQIKATSPVKEAMQATKDAYLLQLRHHAAEVSVLSFSKPEELTARLQAVDLPADVIDKITKGMEQAGGSDELALFVCSTITSESLIATCSEGNSHHHGHGHHHHHHHHHDAHVHHNHGYWF